MLGRVIMADMGGELRARRVVAVLTGLVLALPGLLIVAAPASASAPAGTPSVTDGAVLAIARMGSKVVVAGNFTTLKLPGGATVSQPRLFAYDFATGAFDSGFRPQVDAEVVALAAPSDGSALFIGGSFKTINGSTRLRLAKLNPNGTLNTAFSANATSRVQALSLLGNRLFVGGQFTKLGGQSRALLGEVNAQTGAVSPGFTVGITGSAAQGGFTGVAALEVNSLGNRLLVAHTGRNVGGLERYAVALLDITGTVVTVDPWFTTLWKDYLPNNGGTVRITDAQWGPSGTWFVTTNTGGDRPPVNDSVQRFDTTTPAPAAPTWVTRQFDSAYAVDIDSAGVVYLGGHFRFTEAPGSVDPYPGEPGVNYGFGIDTGGARALGDQVVMREQIDAINPADGKALNWYSSANGLHGVTALKVSGTKLLIGHDGTKVDGQSLGRHGMADLYGHATWDTSRPHTVVETPLLGANLNIGSLTATGTANAPTGSGVRKVQVEVVNPGAKTWLRPDGTWGTFYAFPATLATPNAPTSRWSLTVPLARVGDFKLLVRATDTAGRKEPVKVSVPILANDPSNPAPSVTYTYPSSGQSDFTSNTITVTGTASDPDGIRGVSLSFRHSPENSFLTEDWTLGDYTAFPATLAAPGATTTAWSVTVTLPDGEWTANTKAADLLGAVDTRSNRTFVMSPGNPPPSVTVTAPAPGAVLGDAFTVTGTASDDTSVTRVRVRVADNRFGLSPQIGGTFGTGTYLPADLTAPGAPSTDWSLAVAGLPTGTYTINAYGEDSAGVVTPSSARPSIGVNRWPVGATSEPQTAIATPSADARFADLTLTTTGSADYPAGVAEVRLAVRNVALNRYLQPDGSYGTLPGYFPATLTNPGGPSTSWTSTIALPVAAQWRIDAVAVGTDGNVDSSSSGSRTTYLVFPGDADPTMQLNTPTDGATITGTGGVIATGGRAFDDVGVSAVQVLIANPAGTSGITSAGTVGNPGWVAAFVTNPGGLFTNWTYTPAALPAGTWRVSARAVDSVGKTQLTYPTVTVTLAP